MLPREEAKQPKRFASSTFTYMSLVVALAIASVCFQRLSTKDEVAIDLSFPFTEEQAWEVNKRLKDYTADEVLQWVAKMLPTGVVQFSSFGPTGLVILDKLASMGLLAQVPTVMIDTLHLFPQTYDFVENVSKKYPEMELKVFYPEGFSEGQAHRFDMLHGDDLWTDDFEHYSYLTKVEPTVRALRELEPHAWITGRRRSQGDERGNLEIVESDDGRVKVNPLARWTLEQVWAYIRSHGVPYNPLHDKGYASIGDSMNTRPLEPGETERAGRFMYSGKTTMECGMHAHKARVEVLQKAAEAEHRVLQVPQIPCASCLEVHPGNFEEVVMQADRHVLVEFYSPFCGHCHAFAPRYEEIAQNLSGSEQVTVARMDIFTNNIPKAGKTAGFALHAYPTIYLAHLDKEVGQLRLARYDGEKDVLPLLDWLSEKLQTHN